MLFPLFFFPHYPFKLIFTVTGLFWVASAEGELNRRRTTSFLHSVLCTVSYAICPCRGYRHSLVFLKPLKLRQFLHFQLPHSTPAARLSPLPGLLPWSLCLHFSCCLLGFLTTSFYLFSGCSFALQGKKLPDNIHLH